jgi:ubiquinone/menaquinone biosynthesis C-methylase UbiE
VSLPSELEIKQQVRQFYDQVGWQVIGECCYQNARYEDLRPVSQDYIHRCHMRVSKHLKSHGRYLLDAGSGPIQYPEYLEYSRGYAYRVCADISHVALQEARNRIGNHGLFVVADVANLPFRSDVFEGLISLHTVQHLPEGEQVLAYQGLYRVLAPASTAVVVNRWRTSLFMGIFQPLLWFAKRLLSIYRKVTGRPTFSAKERDDLRGKSKPAGRTFVHRYNVGWFKRHVGKSMAVEILVWRSVSTEFLRTFIHDKLGGRWILKIIFRLEELFPHMSGELGQYPMVVLRKPYGHSSNC